MVTADWNFQQFPHRQNNDGTFDSICPVCFRTVGSAQAEEQLAELEVQHICLRIRTTHRDSSDTTSTIQQEGAA
jgi:hypothetical protein